MRLAKLFPPQLRDSNLGCVCGGDWEAPVWGWSFPRTPPARPPGLCVSHTETLCVSHTDTVSVPHRHCLCSTQTMSLFHRDRTPVDPECTGYGESWSRKFILDHEPQFRGFPLEADQSGKTENSDLNFFIHGFWMNIGQICQKSGFLTIFS